MSECQTCGIQYPDHSPVSGVVTNQAPIPPSGNGSFLARRQAKLARKVHKSMTLIDIGCGNGSFLYAYNNLNTGCETIGVELDEKSIKAAMSAGISVTRNIPQALDHALITMWHVAEHFSVSDFKQVISDLSKGNNMLLISVPNGKSYAWSKHLECYSFFDSKSHMVQYTPRAFNKLLIESGWEIQRIFRTPMYGIFNAIQTGLNLYLPHNEIYDHLKREGNTLSFSLLSRTLVAATKAIGPIIAMLFNELNPNTSSSYTILSIPRKR
jgi:hypothetical protein